MSTLAPSELAGLAADTVVDARGAACPGPLLDAKRAMATIPVGAVVELWSTDPVTKVDVEAWSTKVGHAYLGAAEADGYDRVFVRRGR